MLPKWCYTEIEDWSVLDWCCMAVTAALTIAFLEWLT